MTFFDGDWSKNVQVALPPQSRWPTAQDALSFVKETAPDLPHERGHFGFGNPPLWAELSPTEQWSVWFAQMCAEPSNVLNSIASGTPGRDVRIRLIRTDNGQQWSGSLLEALSELIVHHPKTDWIPSSISLCVGSHGGRFFGKEDCPAARLALCQEVERCALKTGLVHPEVLGRLGGIFAYALSHEENQKWAMSSTLFKAWWRTPLSADPHSFHSRAITELVCSDSSRIQKKAIALMLKEQADPDASASLMALVRVRDVISRELWRSWFDIGAALGQTPQQLVRDHEEIIVRHARYRPTELARMRPLLISLGQKVWEKTAGATAAFVWMDSRRDLPPEPARRVRAQAEDVWTFLQKEGFVARGLSLEECDTAIMSTLLPHERHRALENSGVFQMDLSMIQEKGEMFTEMISALLKSRHTHEAISAHLGHDLGHEVAQMGTTKRRM